MDLLVPISFYVFVTLVYLQNVDSAGFSNCFTNCGNKKDDDGFMLKIRQQVDNKKIISYAVWDQRIFMNQKYYKVGGPIFIMIGGEHEVQINDVTDGACIQYAKELGGACILIERRYFGKSFPTKDLRTENLLNYLNTLQNLEDITHYMWQMKLFSSLDMNKKTKFVTLGTSHGGTLATWLRLKFPDKIAASVSFGAQMFFFDSYGDYNLNIEELLQEEYPKSPNEIREVFKEIKTILNNKDKKKIDKIFNICSSGIDLTVQKQIDFFYWTIIDIFRIIIHYGNTKELMDLKEDVLKPYKDENNSTLTPIQKYARIIKNALRVFKVKCLSVNYDQLVRLYKNTKQDADKFIPFPLSYGLGSRQLYFQKCLEYGTFYTSDKDDYMFGDTIQLDFYIDICTDVFGPLFSLSSLRTMINKMNASYRDPLPDVSKVIFVNGLKDPLWRLGVTQHPHTVSLSLNIKGAHQFTNNSIDSEKSEVDSANSMILQKLKEWLQ